jgi:pimeloyl-ACP methyl ester carboxylesterase
MKKALRWLLYIAAAVVIIYILGPSPATPQYKVDMPSVPAGAVALEGYVKDNESKHKLKPDNEARIIWANDSLKQKTPYAMVYLHGFSASQAEGDPIHRNIAKEFGCNLYLSRLAEHGIDTSMPMLNLTVDEYWESAKQALAIGQQLGDKVILIGTSTGGTNALQLAATYPNNISALVLLSPNLAIYNDKAWILNNHWGLQIAKKVNGSDLVISSDTRPIYKQYWYYQYPLEATVQLQEMLETAMTPELFARVKQPVLMLYYYKDSLHQDNVVKVDAMLQMFDKLGTADNLKRKQAMPTAGNHVLGSYIKSQDLPAVQSEIESFLKQVVGITPLVNSQ